MLRCNLCISRKNIFKIKVLFPNIHTSINAYLCLYWSVLSFYTVITVAAFYSNKTFICRRQRLSSNGRWRHVSTGARLSIKADSQLDLNLFLSFFSKKTKKTTKQNQNICEYTNRWTFIDVVAGIFSFPSAATLCLSKQWSQGLI